MKFSSVMNFRLALLLLIASTHDGFVDGSSFPSSGSTKEDSAVARRQKLLDDWQASKIFPITPHSVVQTSQRPRSSFLSQSDPKGSQSTRSIFQSHSQINSDYRNDGRNSRGQFASSHSSAQLSGGRYKLFSSSRPGPRSSPGSQSLSSASTSSTPSPRSLHSAYNNWQGMRPQMEPNSQQWVYQNQPVREQNLHISSQAHGNRHFFQNPPVGFGVQQGMWMPVPDGQAQNSYRQSESLYGLQSLQPVQNNGRFEKPYHFGHRPSDYGTNLPFKPQQNLQTSNQDQNNYRSLPSTFFATSVAQHVQNPQQSQYLTRPGQNWQQHSSQATASHFAKPESSQQPLRPARVSQSRFPASSVDRHAGSWKPADPVKPVHDGQQKITTFPEKSQQPLRPAQSNYQVSQSRFPVSSVGQHAVSLKPADPIKPVHDGQQKFKFPTAPASLTEWSVLFPSSSQNKDPLASSNYRTPQGSFNDQVLTQVPGSVKPASNDNYGFNPSQNSWPSTHSNTQSVQNIFTQQSSKFQQVQSTSRPLVGMVKDVSSQQQGQRYFPNSYFSGQSSPSTYRESAQSLGPAFSHGMVSGSYHSGRGQTKG